MNSKFYVSLEAAKLLKEKWYNELVKFYYSPIGYINEVIEQYEDRWLDLDNIRSNNLYGLVNNEYLHGFGDYYAAPTKAEAIDWLENKGHRINIIYDWIECKWYFTIINGSPTVKSITELEVSDSVFYNTRLEAEEAAIIKALELL
jgi:hypothetical protein